MKSKENTNKKNKEDEKTMCYKDLLKFKYKPYQAHRIIRLAKDYMVKNGFPLYNNKRMGVFPITAIEKITGIPLHDKEDDRKNDSN